MELWFLFRFFTDFQNFFWNPVGSFHGKRRILHLLVWTPFGMTKCVFLLLINCVRPLLIHGQVWRGGSLFWEIHSLMISRNLFCQLSQDVSINYRQWSVKDCQSLSTINSLPVSMCISPDDFVRMALRLTCLFPWDCNCRPKWSELDKGGIIVLHDWRRDGDGIAMRSIVEELPLVHRWVGSDTTWD